MKVIILYFIELFLGYKYPKSKKVAFFCIALMWILYALNLFNGDYTGYKNNYEWFFYDLNEINKFTVPQFEPGWIVLFFITASLKMSFLGFRIVVATLFVAILYFAVRKYTSNIALALAVFSIFPFSHSFSVMRSGFAALIFAFFAAALLTGDRSKKAVIMFIVGTVCACMFHYSSILLVLLILAYFKLDKKMICIIAGVTICLFVLLKTDIPYNILMTLNLPRFASLASQWLSHQSSPGKLSLGMFACSYALDFYVAYYSYKKCPESYFSKFVLKMYIAAVVFIPFVMATDLFTRLYIAMFIFNICSAVNTLDVCSQGEGKMFSIKKLVTDPYIVVLFVAIAKFLLSDFVYFGTENEGIRCLGQNLLLNLI